MYARSVTVNLVPGALLPSLQTVVPLGANTFHFYVGFVNLTGDQPQLGDGTRISPSSLPASDHQHAVWLYHRFTCEIKKLERGKLVASTSYMGTVYVEWNDIGSISSQHVFEVET